MRKIALPSTAILGAMFIVLLNAAPAQAQLSKTWVSSTGGGTTCSRAAPCATFQLAHDATTAGGEINCVDAGDYQRLTIGKAISIVCDNTQAGIQATTGASAIFINAGASDIITLKGLDIDGDRNFGAGISFINGAALHVHKVQIRNYLSTTTISHATGISFGPNAYSELYVVDSSITDNSGPSAFSGGVLIRPQGTRSANVFINRVQVENNSFGIVADGSQSTGVAVNVVVRDSVVAGSGGDGIRAFTTASHAAASVLVGWGEGCHQLRERNQS
jgi:hypothetical protein